MTEVVSSLLVKWLMTDIDWVLGKVAYDRGGLFKKVKMNS